MVAPIHQRDLSLSLPCRLTNAADRALAVAAHAPSAAAAAADVADDCAIETSLRLAQINCYYQHYYIDTWLNQHYYSNS